MKTHEYDLVAVGGGTAGLVSAAGGRYLGARTALLEKKALGGDCLWTGCVPSKALIASARLAHGMRHADRLGLENASPAHAFEEVMERMRAARERVARHDDPERFRSMGVDVHFGHARFVAPDAVEVEGVGRVRAPRFVLATGAVPAPPPVDGLEAVGYMTYEDAFERDDLSPRLLVLGAGPIGLELAQVFARLGSDVTVVEMDEQVLPREDPGAAAALRDLLEGEGVSFVLGTRVTRAEAAEDGAKALVTADGRRLVGDELLVATGRRPVVDGLGLEVAGIDVENGAVKVDDRLRTTNRKVWAAGDVSGAPQFTHVADYTAKTVLRNALVPLSTAVDYDHVPRVTYTDPELAHVGLLPGEAEARGGRVFEYAFSDLDRAIVDAADAGFVRIGADAKGRILGATILAHGAGDLILPLVLARRHGLTLSDVTDTIFPYPTMSEGVLRAAQAWRRTRLDTLGGRALKKVVSWLA